MNRLTAYGSVLARVSIVVLGITTIIGSGGGGDEVIIGQNSSNATTLPATLITPTAATLNGGALTAINCDTYVWFQWSDHTDKTRFDHNTPPVNVGPKNDTILYNYRLMGLKPDTAYHYRVASAWSSPCSRQFSGSTVFFTTSSASLLYSNGTLTGIWLIKVTSPVIAFNSVRFDGNGNIVEDYDLNPGTLPAPYDVSSDGTYSFTLPVSDGSFHIYTGKLTSATSGSITEVDGDPVTGSLNNVIDLGACQGTWEGAFAGTFTEAFQITVDSTGTITSGSGDFSVPYGGRLFCESGDATGYLATGNVWPLDRIMFQTGAVVSGATMTIIGNYETDGGNGTYTLIK
jgi:hypothetical protein